MTVPRNVLDRDQRHRLCVRQHWKCYWCGGQMRWVVLQGKGKMPPDAATMCHIDTRLSFERGAHWGEHRRVAACNACVTKRAQMLEMATPLYELNRRSAGGRLKSKPRHPFHE